METQRDIETMYAKQLERIQNEPGYALKLLQNAGIADENGELTECYRTPDDYRPQFSVEYVKGLYAKLDEVNKYSIDEIDWIKDGKKVKIKKKEFKEWKFTGLTTTGIIRDFF